jgi:hypothetical protein
MYQNAVSVVAFFVQWPLLLNPLSVCMSEWVQSSCYTALPGFLMYKTLFSHLIFCLVVSIVLDWAGGVCSFLQNIQTSSRVHPPSYAIGTKGSFPRGKVARWPENEGDNSPPSNALPVCLHCSDRGSFIFHILCS